MSATIYDIAEATGVSIATVSRVFNNSDQVSAKTRDRILEVARQMGYHPQAFAQGLASKQKNIVMAIVPVISNYFFMEVLAGIQDKIAATGYELYIYNVTAGQDLFEQVENVIKKRWADGYLCISIHLQEEQWKHLSKYEENLVLIDEYGEDFDSVSSDNVNGAYAATEYLLKKRHRDIVILSALRTSKPVFERIRGYREAMEAYGVDFEESRIIEGDNAYRDGFTEKAGYETMERLLERDRLPDACFCTSDIQAVGALKALNDHGVQLPVISYDDADIASYMNLSTVRQPMYDMGAIATQKLVGRLQNEHIQVSNTVFSPELVIRGSTEVETG